MALYDELMEGTIVYSMTPDFKEIIHRVAPTSLALRAARELAASTNRLRVLEAMLAGTIEAVDEVVDYNPNQMKLF